MGKYLTLFVLLFVYHTSYAQQNHHPTRILITFNAESEISAELWNSSLQATGKLALKQTKDEELHKVATFLEQHTLVNIESLLPINIPGRAKLHSSLPERAKNTYIAEVEDAAHLLSAINKLRLNPQIEIAEPDYMGYGAGIMLDANNGLHAPSLPLDDYFVYQWGLYNTGQMIGGLAGTPGEDINIIPAWEITTGSSDIVMAILDTGIPDNNYDFEGRVLDNFNFVSNQPGAVDDHGHGTSVASIALATGNNEHLIAGVDWNAQILGGKILDENNYGFYSWWAAGIYWAVQEGAHVINISAGGSGYSQILKDAVDHALASGAVVVACMMNTDNEVTHYPAAFDGVIAVGAINNVGERATPFSWGGGSNYGEHIDLVAPGNLIASLVHNNPEAVALWSGTSQATPLVSGVISLMLSLKPNLTNSEILNILTTTARGDGTWNKFTGWGKLDAYAAIDNVKQNYTSTEAIQAPLQLQLYQNYPNPFNPSTEITYKLNKSSHIRLAVYNQLGQEVAELANGFYPSGNHAVHWNAANMASGIYIYRLETANEAFSRKMILLK